MKIVNFIFGILFFVSCGLQGMQNSRGFIKTLPQFLTASGKSIPDKVISLLPKGAEAVGADVHQVILDSMQKNPELAKQVLGLTALVAAGVGTIVVYKVASVTGRYVVLPIAVGAGALYMATRFVKK